jgi:tetratricopeptide (TPR) repeat protein
MFPRLRNTIRQSRFLVWVYAPALAIAGWEIAAVHQANPGSDRNAALVNLGYSLAKQQLLEEQMQLFEELYPDRPQTGTYRGTDALLVAGSLEEARRQFEAALATGVKTDERLLYYYACTLVLEQEDPEKIDAAIANWRKNFPRTVYRDPRTDPNILKFAAAGSQTPPDPSAAKAP